MNGWKKAGVVLAALTVLLAIVSAVNSNQFKMLEKMDEKDRVVEGHFSEHLVLIRQDLARIERKIDDKEKK